MGPICARTFEVIGLERVDLGAGITIGHQCPEIGKLAHSTDMIPMGPSAVAPRKPGLWFERRPFLNLFLRDERARAVRDKSASLEEADVG